jgi:xanthine dehydrogenase YagR molybdenum-binding subunit
MTAIVGRPIDRVDGRLKLTGAARYTADHLLPGLAHAVLVTSTIAKGRIVEMDTRAARRVPGVLAILTHEKAPKLAAKSKMPETPTLQLLQDDAVRYANQPIAVVVAESLEAAHEGAERVVVGYETEPHDVGLDAALARAYHPEKAGGDDAETRRGDVAAGLAAAAVRLEETYTTPLETHNPMEPHATTAVWERPRRLLLYDATQGIFDCRARVAEIFGLPESAVRVVSSYLGGGFGSKGPTWSHVALAAVAARHVRRPVRLALTRPQMFGSIGWRSRTRQTIALGVGRDGTLTALHHDTVAQTSSFDEFAEAAGRPTRMLYASPNLATRHRLVRADIGTPSYMRAPGWAPGTYALECAMDEMAVALGMDPLEFRLNNYAGHDPETDHLWSSKALRECYRQGAERFGWSRRPPAPRTRRDGDMLIGWGMATSVYPTHRSEAAAIARVCTDGTVLVQSGTQDLGTGTYTIMTQVAADALGLPPDRVAFALGDTRYPEAPISGGSMTAASVGSAVHLAALALRRKIVRLAIGDRRSPLAGQPARSIRIENGRLVSRRDAEMSESLEELVVRHPGTKLEARAKAVSGDEEDRYAMYAFGAQFVEVRVDAALGSVRVSRMVGVFDIGRVLNAKTARSQLFGGMVGGLGMALHEETVFDERLGRVVNNNLAEYHVPVQADVPDIEVAWIDGADPRANPLGAKGIGELGITGAAAAVANAVYHATGRRVRDLPITLDKLI